MTHSLTPWTTRRNIIVSKDNIPVCGGFLCDDLDMPFIVRAVNAHAELVAALKAMLACPGPEAQRLAQDVLAKLGGGQ